MNRLQTLQNIRHIKNIILKSNNDDEGVSENMSIVFSQMKLISTVKNSIESVKNAIVGRDIDEIDEETDKLYQILEVAEDELFPT